jgi:hypothetical protein
MEELTNMSQQHMEYDESQRERPDASYTAYEGVPPYNSYSAQDIGQKLSGHEIGLLIFSAIVILINVLFNRKR